MQTFPGNIFIMLSNKIFILYDKRFVSFSDNKEICIWNINTLKQFPIDSVIKFTNKNNLKSIINLKNVFMFNNHNIFGNVFTTFSKLKGNVLKMWCW